MTSLNILTSFSLYLSLVAMSDEILVKGTALRYFSFHGGIPKTSHTTLISHLYNTYITLILHISHYNIHTYIVIPVDELYDLFLIPSAPAGITDGLYDDLLLYCAVLRDTLRPIKL